MIQTKQKTHLLANARVYLCGPIENSNEPINWRDKASAELSKLGMVVWNPLVKPFWMSDIDGKRQREMRDKLHIHEIKLHNHSVRLLGLHLVANCDIVLLRINGEPTIGTYEELSVAKYKPVICWCDEDVPSMWLVDQLNCYDYPHYVFHRSINDIMSYLRKVDSGVIDVPDRFRWSFVTYGDNYNKIWSK